MAAAAVGELQRRPLACAAGLAEFGYLPGAAGSDQMKPVRHDPAAMDHGAAGKPMFVLGLRLLFQVVLK